MSGAFDSRGMGVAIATTTISADVYVYDHSKDPSLCPMHPVRHPRISSCMHAPWIPPQKVMKHIASSLEHPHDKGVRAAAAKCVLALSRSVQNLRSSVIETEVAVALCRLLKDTSPRVQVIYSYRAFALCACAGRQSPQPFYRPPPTTIHPWYR